MQRKYDAIIIGAGMSGLAAGIRLSMYDKKVCILEKHFVPGGLNSYYKRGKIEFDVGLHAMTNFVQKGTRGRPLTKLLKQLRIPYDQFELDPQEKSKIQFSEKSLGFTNDLDYLRSEIHQNFPSEIDGFNKLIEKINTFNEVSLTNPYLSAKELVSEYIKDQLLLEMIFCPLLIYGSAWENDMDFSQFVIMFKSIFMEGFSRPKGGVRTIINLLLKKLEEHECELRYKSEVVKIEVKNNKACGVHLKNGEFLESDLIISSMGLPETFTAVTGKVENQKYEIGKMSFTESILLMDKRPKDYGVDTTIIFYNNSDKYDYRCPSKLYDNSSAVICFPNNFKNDTLEDGWVRITNMANYKLWKELERPTYKEQKDKVFADAITLAKKVLPGYDGATLFKDVFSPTTIEKYTGHFGGTVYGSTTKSRDGSTEIEGLKICGTDQGFLGIVGAMLSGISMANLYGLMEN